MRPTRYSTHASTHLDNGTDAILGHSLTAKSLAVKALRRHAAGEMGRIVPQSRGLFGL